MTGNEYQSLSMRTNDGEHEERLHYMLVKTRYEKTDIAELFNACLGLSGETGELIDMVKKWIFHEKVLDEDHLKKELGDVMWYVAMFCKAMGWELDEILQMNVDKLKARYPEGFDTELSNHRKEGDL